MHNFSSTAIGYWLYIFYSNVSQNKTKLVHQMEEAKLVLYEKDKPTIPFSITFM